MENNILFGGGSRKIIKKVDYKDQKELKILFVLK
jgi:hypothetical protein